MTNIIPVNGNRYKIRINSYTQACSAFVAEDAKFIGREAFAVFEKNGEDDVGAFHLVYELPWWIDARDVTVLEEIV